MYETRPSQAFKAFNAPVLHHRSVDSDVQQCLDNVRMKEMFLIKLKSF